MVSPDEVGKLTTAKLFLFLWYFFTSFHSCTKNAKYLGPFATMPSENIYKPLSSPRSIRILYLIPSIRRDSLLSEGLREVNLDDRPAYGALSYVWGEKEPADSIILVPFHDTELSLTLSITPHYGQALRHL